MRRHVVHGAGTGGAGVRPAPADHPIGAEGAGDHAAADTVLVQQIGEAEALERVAQLVVEYGVDLHRTVAGFVVPPGELA